jgi:hypothetical protein
MKTIKLLSFVLFGMMAAVNISCSSDSDSDSGSGSLTPAKYESESALYQITDGNSQYKSVELTASGNYVIVLNQKSYKAPALLARPQIFAGRPLGITRDSNYDDNIIYGTYTKKGDSYVLSGFGTITVVGGGSNAISLDITRNDGTKVTVSAQKHEQYASSTMTNNLCRTWEFAKIHVKVSAPGNNVDKTFKTYAEFMRFIYGMDDDEGIDDEYYQEALSETPKQVIFTKSGTYIVFYTNGTLAVSTWAWVNESKGEARYSWDYESLYNDNESGRINISFSGNQLVITEFIEEYYEKVKSTIDIEYYMSEVK